MYLWLLPIPILSAWLCADHAYTQLHAADVSKDHMLTLLAQADAEKAAAQSAAATATSSTMVVTTTSSGGHMDHQQVSPGQTHIIKHLQAQLEVSIYLDCIRHVCKGDVC
jgi:hypothetical protein